MLVAVALAFGALPLAAQQPSDQAKPDALRPPDPISRPADPIAPPPAQITRDQSEPQLMTTQGQLVKVDAAAKTITIKTLAEPELKFSYSDATKVVGAGESVAGLATLSGTDITVKYMKRGSENVATEINVQKPKA
jgi:hypothetical protein